MICRKQKVKFEGQMMNVAIVGTGNVGASLGRSLSKAGHSVTFYGRDEAKKAEVASQNDAAAAESVVDAVKDADVIVLAVPYAAAADVARDRTGSRGQGRYRHDEPAQARLHGHPDQDR